VRARVQAYGPRYLWLLVGGLTALYLLIFGMSAAARLARPLDEFSYGEAWLLDDARRVARGESLYTAPDRLPITQTAYMPVYYVVVSVLLRVFGDHGYTLGRSLSLAAMIGSALLLVWTARRLSGCATAGWLAGGLFLTQNLTAMLWAPQHRVDALALAFTLAGLALFVGERRRLAALAFVLAVMTKQTFLVAPVAACIALWPCRRDMLRFALMFGAPLVVSVAVAQWVTSGWFLWHTLVANSNQADFYTFAVLTGSFLQFNGLLVLAAAASLTVPGTRPERVWRLYFLGCLAMLPTIAKIGASSNYWLELTAATAVLVALASVRLAARPEPLARAVPPLVLAGTLLFSVVGYQATARAALDLLREASGPGSADYLSLVSDSGTAPLRVQTSFVDRIAREPGELLTDNPGLAVAAGKPITYEFQFFQMLSGEGRWSDQPVVDAIHARRFPLVVLMHPLDTPVEHTRWTPGIRDALAASYVLAGQEPGFWLYRPGR
jgi:hypothetical protein